MKKEKAAEKQRKSYRRQVDTLGLGVVNLIKKFRRKEVICHLGGSCMGCGYSLCIRNLVFHHVVEETKSFNLQERVFSKSWASLTLEVRKCVLLCHNCHGEVHEGLRSVEGMLERVQTLMNSFIPSPRSSYKLHADMT